MRPAQFLDVALTPALTLLPGRMDSPEARAMVIAVCLQESRLEHRTQVGGPARGFAQFEISGVRGVLNHRASREPIRTVLDAMVYDTLPDTSFAAIAHNDVLACCYARLLLWTLPDALPGQGEADEGWAQYVEAWRPGKPHPATWPGYFAQAWATVG